MSVMQQTMGIDVEASLVNIARGGVSHKYYPVPPTPLAGGIVGRMKYNVISFFIISDFFIHNLDTSIIQI